RIFAVSALGCVLLAGCTMPQTGSGKAANRMAGSFCAEVTVTNADSETKGVLTRFGTDAWRVAFTAPAALSGVQLDFLDSEVTASYKGLEFSVPQSAQAIRTELAELMEAVDALAPEEALEGSVQDGAVLCEGEVTNGSYSLLVGEDGTPVNFSLPNYGVVISFDSFAEQSGLSPTEETTLEKTFPVEDTTAADGSGE
ncbi:MAG: hypothetical protein IKN55_08195, partial [Oscillospiraceae bacterium]|nr:hypothetical protein [Oscillospiraceae bacterium]